MRVACLCAAFVALGLPAADWPQFLGPNRNGTTSESVRTQWPEDGPPALWSRSLGAGFSGPVVSHSRVLIHHRRDERELLECLDLDHEGRTLWESSAPTAYHDDFGFDNGPRATPTISGSRVFTLGAGGLVSAVELATGKGLWQFDGARELGANKGFFGFACSPLVHGNLVLVALGGKDGAGIVALSCDDGRLRWKVTDHEASYSSPVVATLDGQPRAAFWTREGLVVLDPETGRLRSEFPWRSRQHASVNAAAPLVLGPRVFLTASYGTGAILLDLQKSRPSRVWSGDEQLSSHYASVVQRNGFIFGFHGRQEYGPSLRCIEADTGKVQWTRSDLGAGTLILAADQLVVLTERGELLVGTASAKGFAPSARAQVLGGGVRSMGALSSGRFLARDPRTLVCLDLRPGAPP